VSLFSATPFFQNLGFVGFPFKEISCIFPTDTMCVRQARLFFQILAFFSSFCACTRSISPNSLPRSHRFFLNSVPLCLLFSYVWSGLPVFLKTPSTTILNPLFSRAHAFSKNSPPCYSKKRDPSHSVGGRRSKDCSLPYFRDFFSPSLSSKFEI